MQTLSSLLTETEPKWRDQVSEHYPLWSSIPIIKIGRIEPERDWSFSTNLKRINALIFNDKNLQRKFQEIVTKFWDGEPEELAQETLHYLLYHELYHHLEAPFSTRETTGDDNNDSTKIHQAIRNGLLKAQPEMSPLEQTMKVSASQNIVKDFILDNRVYLENQQNGWFREDVIPIWDLLELHGEKPETNLYTITRAIYGSLYGPGRTSAFFIKKVKKNGCKEAEKALSALLQKPVSLPKESSEKKSSIKDKLKSFLTSSSDPTMEERDNLGEEYVSAIREVFSGEDRYKGIERFIEILAPYINTSQPQGRCDQSGEGSGCSSNDLLQDLLDDMDETEQQQFLSQLANEAENNEGNNFQDGTADSTDGSASSQEEIVKLELSTLHQFYKRNHPEVKIVGGGKKGETVVVGKTEKFVLKNTKVLTSEQVSRLPLGKIARFQQRSKLPVLTRLKNGLYRLNEYDTKEREVKDIKYVDLSLDVPEEVEFYVDSSGSMYQGSYFGFNDGSRWDMVSNVLYGYVSALYQASRKLNKPCSIQIYNVADTQKSSRKVPVQEFLEKGSNDVLETLFKPHNGYSEEDLNIQIKNDGKRRTYVIVTDGQLVISGRTARESAKMKQLSKQSNTDVILFEIGGSYGLGSAVKNHPNIHYHPVYDKNAMLQQGLEVLVGK